MQGLGQGRENVLWVVVSCVFTTDTKVAAKKIFGQDEIEWHLELDVDLSLLGA
jgi:hypothetical protein